MNIIEEFLLEIDHRRKPETLNKIPLKIIGSSALLLHVGYDRGTKDSDVLETSDITPSIKKQFLSLAGKGSPLSQSYRIYLDVVASGIPFSHKKPITTKLKR